MKLIFTFILGIAFCFSAEAAKFKGYKRAPNSTPLILSGAVQRVQETPTAFLILIARHAAFYSFPKSKDYEDQVRIYLKQRIKDQQAVELTIDPMNAQILTLQDAT